MKTWKKALIIGIVSFLAFVTFVLLLGKVMHDNSKAIPTGGVHLTNESEMHDNKNIQSSINRSSMLASGAYYDLDDKETKDNLIEDGLTIKLDNRAAF